MKSYFEKINEKNGEPYHTKPLNQSKSKIPDLIDTLARISAIIKAHFVPGVDWKLKVHKGSLTFQKEPV